jgi:hypothetical protein
MTTPTFSEQAAAGAAGGSPRIKMRQAISARPRGMSFIGRILSIMAFADDQGATTLALAPHGLYGKLTKV